MFQAPEQANIEYIVLDLESVKKSISLNEADLKSYYDQNAVRLSGNEQRRASHILINATKDATEADRQKARTKAEEILQMVRKLPESFADLAKKYSQDTGSAVNGGDLDFFARGAMVKQFEDAAFSMKKGDVSELVASDFGYHIIKLTDIKTPKQRSFEELRAGIETDLKSQQAQRKFAETAESFTNGVYEQSDSLKPIADKLKLDIKTASNVTRKATPGSSTPAFNEKFLAALFSPDAVDKKRNTEAIETAPSQLMAGRIVQYTPARTVPFNDVRSVVRDRVVSARATELAKKDGLEKLAVWKATPATATLPVATVVSRDQSQSIKPQLLAAALRTPNTTLPVFVGVDLGELGYSVIKVNKILQRPAPTPEVVKQDVAQYSQWWANAENQAYYSLLKERFKVEILTARPLQTQ
jgi:peptidyl-prolyl cis-trans isomerase D